MPVGKGTVPQSVKYTQYQPGGCSEEKACEVQLPGLFPYPAEEVEQDQAGMENCKKYVKESHT